MISVRNSEERQLQTTEGIYVAILPDGKDTLCSPLQHLRQFQMLDHRFDATTPRAKHRKTSIITLTDVSMYSNDESMSTRQSPARASMKYDVRLLNDFQISLRSSQRHKQQDTRSGEEFSDISNVKNDTDEDRRVLCIALRNPPVEKINVCIESESETDTERSESEVNTLSNKNLDEEEIEDDVDHDVPSSCIDNINVYEKDKTSKSETEQTELAEKS